MGDRNGITAPKGFVAGGIHCGVKKSGAKDLAIIASETAAVAAGVFTTNQFKGAPVLVSMKNIKSAITRAIVVNSGCSNVLNRTDMRDAQRMVKALAEELNCPESQILVASTGVIGVPLPIEKIEHGIEELAQMLKARGGSDAAEAIMTTDLVKKEAKAHLAIGAKRVTVGGCAKGSGMIHPSMATMLAFVTTDAAVTKPVVKDILKRACDVSFNRITVDGDTSTSDTLILMANGASGAPVIDKTSGADYSLLLDKVTEVCSSLARQVVRDGEGATKFVTVNVTGAVSEKAADKVAVSVAKSSLVKTALFGEDANWGRILCAAGYAGVPINPAKVTLKIGPVTVFEKGLAAEGAWEKKVTPHLKKKDVTINIDLGAGESSATVWTCDLSYDYVKINADYRT